MREPEFVRRLASAGQETVRIHYSWRSVSDRLERYLAEVAGGPVPSDPRVTRPDD